MSPKAQKVVYWICTVLVALMSAMSGVALLMRVPQNVEGFAHLGYPLYFMTLLGTAKSLGAAALLYPRFPRITEWAYAGFTFTFLAASFSHLSSNDGAGKTIAPLVMLAFLAVSYHFFRKTQSPAKP